MARKYSFLYILIGSAAVFCVFVVGGGGLHGQSDDPATLPIADLNSYVFQLELGGVVVAEYTECSGLGSNSDIEENSVVGDSGTPIVHKTPGALRWPDIKLRRRTLSNGNVWSWRQLMEKGDMKNAVRDGSITVLTAAPANVWVGKWVFHAGWPASLIFDGSGEELVIVHQGLDSLVSATVPSACRS